jgi:RNA ligase
MLEHEFEICWNDIQPILANHKEFMVKEEIVNGHRLKTVCYLFQADDTFDSPLARELRGIVFDEDGACICRPFHKFFNVGETRSNKKIEPNWSKSTFSQKWDGSMLMPVLLDGKIFWKSRKTFYSDTVKKAQRFTQQTVYTEIALQFLEKGQTPIFELVGPHNPLVIQYEEDDLVFLAARDIKSGYYAEFCKQFPMKWAEIPAMEGIEGFVVWDTQELYKLKTQWYMERFRVTMGENMKSIVQAAIDNKIDDMMPLITTQTRKDEVWRIAKKVWDDLEQRLIAVDVAYHSIDPMLPQKDFALEVNAKYPSLSKYIFMQRAGKDERCIQKVKEDIARDWLKYVEIPDTPLDPEGD